MTAPLGDLGGRRAAARREAQRQSARLQTLWSLNVAQQSDERFVSELIGDAAGNFREGERFAGILAHREGADMVIDVASEPFASAAGMAPGSRFGRDEGILGRVLAVGETASWDDVRRDGRFPLPRGRGGVWRAVIATPFRADRDYCLCFASERPLSDDAFGPVDHAFVETLASLYAGRLRDREQSRMIAFEREHDQLTRLYNRATFRSRGVAALENGRGLALIVADIDRFRALNHSLGHLVGDALLREVATRLSSRLQGNEILARLGGDSFGILVLDVVNRAEIEKRLAGLATAFDDPFDAPGEPERRVHLTASYGIATAPEDAKDFGELLARADAATFEAKDAGRDRRAFFDARIGRQFGATQGLRGDILRAIARDELALYLQPHVDLRTGVPTGAEALVRWRNPERGLILPADFIPFAEHHGLAPALGEWVMRQTLSIAARLRARSPDFCLWLNLSATELDVGILAPRVAALGGPVAGVGIEITETSAMRDVMETARAVELLRAAGFAIALDDFGTGYSSLSHLRRLPIDVVKIDRSFVRGLPDDPHDVAIVEAVLSIAARFGFQTIAEGVETPAQAALLAARGCTSGQGYLYARPMPLAAFECWLDGGRRFRTMVRAS